MSIAKTKTTTKTDTAMILATGFLLLSNGLAYAASLIHVEPPPVIFVSPEERIQTITEKLLHLNTVYRNDSKADHIERLTAIRSLAQDRKILLRQLMHDDPHAVLAVALGEAERLQFPPEVLPSLEHPIIAEGYWSSPIANGQQYFLLRTSQGEQYWLHFTEAPPTAPPESRIRINGIQIDDDVIVPTPLEQNFIVLQ